MAAATAVNVTWRIPDIDGRPVGARSFLQYRQLGKGDWDSVPDEEHEDFWQQIEGLKEATPYQVRVVTKTGQYGTESYREAASDQRTFTTTGVGKYITILSANIVYYRTATLMIGRQMDCVLGGVKKWPKGLVAYSVV